MNKNSSIVCLLLVVTVVFWTMACASSPISEPKSMAMTTIRDIKDHPDVYAGRTIMLSGRFKGWKGSCSEVPPKSRSDWMVEDDTGCIYVSGSVPLGLQPISPKDETIAVTAVVRLTKLGVPYLEIRHP